MVARGKCERSKHAAPGSQIKSARAPEGRQTLWPVSVGLPGLYFFSRTFQGLRASRSPLATHLPRLRRSNDHLPDQATMINDVNSRDRTLVVPFNYFPKYLLANQVSLFTPA
jgi:hypothetical protein